MGMNEPLLKKAFHLPDNGRSLRSRFAISVAGGDGIIPVWEVEPTEAKM